MQGKDSSLKGFSQEDSYEIAIQGLGDGTGWGATKRVLCKISEDAPNFETALWLAEEWDTFNQPPYGAQLKSQLTGCWNFVHSNLARLERGTIVQTPLDYARTEAIVEKYGPGAAEKILSGSQPVPPIPQLLTRIFPGNSGVGVAHLRKEDQRVLPLSDLKSPHVYSWLSPNPFKYAYVKNGERWSMKCDANVAARWNFVVEFDLKEEKGWTDSLQKWKTRGLSLLDVHCALFLWLASSGDPRFKPFMIVFSGSQSYHGWYDARNLSEAQIAAFLQRAVPLGGDAHALTPSQLFRMPGGTRRFPRRNQTPLKVKQQVIYWNPKET